MTPPWPVAITGLGCLCAAGMNLDDCMAALYRGERAPVAPTRFSSSHPLRYPVFEVHGFQEPPELLRTSALGLHAAQEALADAGLDAESLRGLRVGVCVGTTVGSAMNNESFCRDYRAGLDPDLEPIERILRSNPAAVIARAFELTGPCQTVVNACASGTDAIGLAASWIRGGLCDLAIAGGADELGRITYNGFISLMISDDSPCQPFDRHRKGLNLGEGAAMLVLESAESRRRRGRRARSYLLGYGSACDAHHLTAPRLRLSILSMPTAPARLTTTASKAGSWLTSSPASPSSPPRATPAIPSAPPVPSKRSSPSPASNAT